MDEGEPPPLLAADLLDKPVYDVNGEKLGRVTLAREFEGRVVSFDVQLTPRARLQHHVRDPYATLDPEDVVATDFAVSLDDDADHVLAGRLAGAGL